MKNRFSLGLATLVIVMSVILVPTAFAARRQQSLTITWPTGDIVEAPTGEIATVWSPGTVHFIQWNSTGLAGQVLQFRVVNEITGENVSLGSLTLTVDGWQGWDFIVPEIPLGHYRVLVQAVSHGRIIASDAGGEVVVQELYPGQLTIVSPTYGDILTCGRTATIQWVGADSNGDVSLKLTVWSVQTGQTVQVLDSVNPTDGAYVWRIHNLPVGMYVIVLVGDGFTWGSDIFNIVSPPSCHRKR